MIAIDNTGDDVAARTRSEDDLGAGSWIVEMEEVGVEEWGTLTMAEGVGEGEGDRVVEATLGTTVQLVTTHEFLL